MRYVIFAIDGNDAENIRKAYRQAHIDYMQTHPLAVETAGPLVVEDGGRPIGSLIILKADNRREVEAYSDGDPYTKAGLFKEVRIEAFKKTLG